MVVLEDHDHRRARREALEEGPPGGEQLLRSDPRSDPEEGQQRRLDPAALVGVRDVRRQRLADLRPRGRFVVGLQQAAATADHLAQGPERDPLTVRGGSAVVPPDVLDQAVEVLRELPGQARLADPRRAEDRDEAGALLSPGGVEQLLEQAQLVGPAHERRLERLAPVPSPALRHDPQRPPGGDRGGLALEGLVAGRLEGDRAARRPLGRLAHEDRPRPGSALEPAGGVDEVARHHALVRRPDRHRRFTGHDAGTRLDGRAERPHRVDELQAGPDGPFRVVLARDGCSPDGHHRVADELLHPAAVPGDDVGGDVEVAGQELPGLLRVVSLRERGEPDQVGEQHRDEAALGDRGARRDDRPRAAGTARGDRSRRGGGYRPGGCAARQRRGAFAAELGRRAVRRPAGGAGNREARGTFRAELRPAGLTVPQFAQTTRSPCLRSRTGRPKRTRHRAISAPPEFAGPAPGIPRATPRDTPRATPPRRLLESAGRGPERSHRGLVQRFAKPPCGVTCIEGSNPSLSATHRAPVAQWIERQVADLKVVGSSPAGRATFPGRATIPR